MLTDLRLQKYLEGRLNAQESRELEALLEKFPEMRERLDALKAEGEGAHIGHLRRRRHLEPKVNRGSRIRTGTVLPALVLLLIILGLASHWFSRPGANSTFSLQASTGHTVELLYESGQGWRYFDAGFKPGDSLSFSIRENGSWHVAVMAVEVYGRQARLLPIWEDDPAKIFTKKDVKPIFPSLPDALGDAIDPKALRHYVAFFSSEPLPDFQPDEAADILQGIMPQRDAASYRFQVFSVKPSENP